MTAVKPRKLRRTVVEGSEWLTSSLVRIKLGGEELAGFAAGEFSDHYVKVQLPPPGADYGPGADFDRIRATRSRAEHPRTRTYSVRSWDRESQRLAIDFLVHGGAGVGGPWARSARPGDVLQLLGPGGSYTPSPEADWHLLAGDTCVLPAICASLERMPPDVPAVVVIEVDREEDKMEISSKAVAEIHWACRAKPAGEEPDLLTEVVRDLRLPEGQGQAFVHGEASSVRNLRRHLVADRKFPAEALSASGYWKHRLDEERWREAKPAWQEQVSRDTAQLA